MINIPSQTPNIRRLKLTDKKKLSMIERNGRRIMKEYGDLFKSKTLEELYSPEYKYDGSLPNATYIKNKKTGKRTLMFVTKSIPGKQCLDTYEPEFKPEIYTARNKFLYSIGEKIFGISKQKTNPKIQYGTMISFNNKKYAGTQIRLTQIEVERAMANGINRIPVFSLAEALPFHTMMGFRPKRSYREIENLDSLRQEMYILETACCDIRKENLTPIIHKKFGKFYFDENQTVANGILRQMKEDAAKGEKRDFRSVFQADCIEMELSGKELEAWKQRAISQPILSRTKEMIKQNNM